MNTLWGPLYNIQKRSIYLRRLGMKEKGAMTHMSWLVDFARRAWARCFAGSDWSPSSKTDVKPTDRSGHGHASLILQGSLTPISEVPDRLLWEWIPSKGHPDLRGQTCPCTEVSFTTKVSREHMRLLLHLLSNS